MDPNNRPPFVRASPARSGNRSQAFLEASHRPVNTPQSTIGSNTLAMQQANQYQVLANNYANIIRNNNSVVPNQTPAHTQELAARIPSRHKTGDDGAIWGRQEIEALTKFILEIKNLLLAKTWEVAYDKLTDVNAVRNLLGIRLTLNRAPKGSTYTALGLASKNRAVGEISNRPSIDIFTLFKDDGTWLSDDSQAKPVLMMCLEEFMHILQAKQNNHLSDKTGEYKRSSELLDKNEHERTMMNANDVVDFDEIDILATFQDWGFDFTGIPFISNYHERIVFNKWRASV